MKKKKKQGKGLLLAVLALILLLVVYFVIDLVQKKQETKETESEEVSLPVSVTEEELAKVTVSNDGTVMTFEKKDDTWIYQEDSEFPLDEDSVSSKMNSLSGISVDRVLESPEDLAEYGLEEPKLEITVEKTDGSSFTLSIGDKNSSTYDYYVKVNDDSNVYTIGSTVPNNFDFTPYDVAESEDFPTIEAENIKSFQVEKEDQTIEFAVDDATGVVWSLKGDDGRDNSVDSTKMDELKNAAASLSYNGFVDYKGEDLDRYGLKDPKAQLTVVTEETQVVTKESETDEEETGTEQDQTEETETETEAETETITVTNTVVLLIGDTNEDGDYYVKQKDSQEVHTMSESALETFLSLNKLDYLSTYLNDVPMTDMESLKVTYEGKTRILTITTEEVVKETEAAEENETESSEEGSSLLDNGQDALVSGKVAEKLEAEFGIEPETETETEIETETETETEPETEIVYHYLVDDHESDETAFRTFYNNLVLLKAQKRMEEADAANVSETPDFEVEFTRKDGTTLNVKYYLADDGLYDVISDGALPARISKLEVQKVLDYYKDLTVNEDAQKTETEE